MKSWNIGIAIMIALGSSTAHGEPLVTLEHNVVGAQLRVDPGELFVPKDIPGSLAVDIVTAGGATGAVLGPLARGTHVEAVLRGPAFPAYRLLGLPNEPLLLPPIALTGEYRIDDLRLVDTATGDVLMMGVPSSVPVHVFPHVLVSHVESRPLSLDEITARGIVIDATSFSAVEFEAAFIVGGKSFPVRFPVVTPKFRESTDIIPRAELDERLAEAERINRELAKTIPLPPELDLPGLDLDIRPLNFQRVPVADEEADLDLPPIPGLVVIPGNIGFLNQFFSVQVFVANAAPLGSRIAVHSLEARIVLPNGKDLLPNTSDDPVALARTAADPQPLDRLPILSPGQDGQWGSSGAESRLDPGHTGRAEFVVEGQKPGLHALDFVLTGVLDGLAAGDVPITGRAAGAVLVRNPKFSIVFAHPHTIRAGEPYTASVTVLNTSEVDANLVSVNLNAASISGAILDPSQLEQVDLGTIASGESATAEYRLIAQRTGQVLFSNLTGDDDLTGRFDLTMAVDERGVALSSQNIGYPDWVEALPPSVRRAADRVLGQALSVATAAILPPGVRSIDRSIVAKRVIELAEAGQRLQYGDAPSNVYLDLLLDWHGGRSPSLGFDQILRTTGAGGELETAITAIAPSGLPWIAAQSEAIAGRGEAWAIASTGHAQITAAVTLDGVSTGPLAEDVTQSGAYLGPAGWIVPILGIDPAPALDARALEVTFEVPALGPSAQVAWTAFDGTGGGTHRELTVTPDPSDRICYRYLPQVDASNVTIDVACDGTSDGLLAASGSSIVESAPVLISATQDLAVLIGRPRFCNGPSFDRFGVITPYRNYGTLVAVLFGKPMSEASIEAAGAFALDNGTPANGVALQPGGRVALVNLRNGLRGSIPRTLITTGITDERGHALSSPAVPIAATADQGVSVDGRVIAGDGSPVPGVPVTLTMHDQQADTFGCQPFDVRASQVLTGADGRFTFDFVMAGLPYTLATTDTRGMAPEAVAFLLEASPTGPFDPAELERLVRDPEALAELQAFFDTSSVEGSIAAAEGIDRATFRDFVVTGSPRLGSTVPVALRFRGRGTVFGTVYASDGVTTVRDAAVNLFPDIGSRELGRGVFSSQSGTYRFYGVPVGPFTLEAETGTGQHAIVAGLLDTPGGEQQLDLILSSAAVPRGEVRGVVYEADGVTPHPGAKVMVVEGALVVRAADADATGAFVIDDVPVGQYDLAALSFDGQRLARRPDQLIQANATLYASLLLPGTSQVIGRVELPNGQPVAGALVAGGDAVVTTDSGGNFLLMGVPVGRRTIAAGVAPGVIPGIDFVRLGSETIDVFPGAPAFAVVRLRPAGRIHGHVLDAAGAPVPSVRVAIPRPPTGFYWTNADASGAYHFDNLNLDEYIVAAPAPPAADVEGSLAAIQAVAAGTADDQLLAALGTTLSLYASGFDLDYDPGSYGFAYADLAFDGQNLTADIRYLREGTVSGTVLNGNGVPIGASVELEGIGPNKLGGPVLGPVAVALSDPALGTFSFANVRVGDFTLSASSPFYPVPVTYAAETTLATPNASNIVLQFPPSAQTGGRVTGIVRRDGAPVPAGVRVHISLSPTYEILTTPGGTFDTQIDLPSGGYDVEALDPVTGRVAAERIQVRAGAVTNVELDLLATNGALDVAVLQASGAPANGAAITARQITHPQGTFQATASASGQASFTSLIEGRYAVTACFTTGQSQLCKSNTVNVSGAATAQLVLTLGGAGTIAGVYVESDGVTPVGFAQIAIGQVGYTTSDASGAFSLQGVPLGTHTILGRNAVTGRAARTTASLTQVDQTVQVTLREDDLGEVVGRVIGSDGATSVPGAFVSITPSNNLFSRVTVTSDPLGRFSFPGVPPGSFVLDARDAVEPALLHGRATGVMPITVGRVTVDVPFLSLASLTVTVLDPGGAPANALITIPGGSVGTDPQGQARLTRLPMGTLTLEARSLVAGQTHSTAIEAVRIDAPGEAPPVTLDLSGVGGVDGTVTNASGAPVSGAQVVVEMTDAITGPDTITAITSGTGTYSIDDVALGAVRARATLGALAGGTNGAITGAGQRITLNVTLGPSATVFGSLVRADGVSPVPNSNITIRYDAPSGADGTATDRTDMLGAFSFDAIPEGPFVLEASVPYYDGVLYHPDAIPAGQTSYDVGDVALDEDVPAIVTIVPSDGATGVLTTSNVSITFSEAMDPLVTDPDAVYVTNGIAQVPASLSWAPGPDARTLVLDPTAPLASETAYTVVVSAGDVIDLGGNVLARGPVDLAQRPLAAPSVTTFTTIDSVAPSVLSFTPANGAVQVPIDGVVRVSFSEAMDPASVQLTLSGPGGSVPGTLSLGLNQRIAVYVPSALLAPNGSYTASLLAAEDLAGNSVANLPSVQTFATLDTIGPSIADLAVANNLALVQGGTATILATLAAPEASAQVQLTPDLATYYASAVGSLSVSLPITAPPGALTLYAHGVDRFGNHGPIYQETFTVTVNQPPQVGIVQQVPASGALRTGQTYTFRIEALDDGGVVRITSAIAGAFTNGATNPGPGPAFLSGTVPSTLGPGQGITVTAEAEDNAGVVVQASPLTAAIEDGTPPALSISAGTTVSPGQLVTVDATTTDTFGVTSLAFQTTGAVTTSDGGPITPSTSYTRSFTFTVPANATGGASIVATVVATDAAGNATTRSSTYVVTAPSTPGPQIVAITPSDNATNIGLRPTIEYQFDAAVDPGTLTAGTLTLEAEVGGAVTPTTLTIANANHTFRFVPNQALVPGAVYRLRLAGTPTGNGNPIRNPAGLTFTEHVTRFTAARIDLVIAGGARGVEGFGTIAQLVPESSAPVTAAAWRLDGIDLGSSSGSSPTFNLPIPTLAQNPSGVTIASAVATVTSIGLVNVPSLSIAIEAAGADFDQDGIANGTERVFGLDPWTADAAADPDLDGLTNAQEVAIGTNPFDDDTDGDGLTDGADPDPLVGNRRPGAGLVDGLHLTFDGTADLALPSSTRIAAPLAIEAWVYPTADGAFLDSGSNDAIRLAYASGGFTFSLATAGQGTVAYASPFASAAGQWHHVAMVYDGARLRSFVDGRLAVDQARSGAIAYTAELTRVDPAFRGRLDELRLWSIPRSATSLMANMHRAVPASEPGLFASYRLDDGAGTIAGDETGNGHDAALTAPVWSSVGRAPLHQDTRVLLGSAQAILQLEASDLDNDPLSYVVTRLPSDGRLYEYDAVTTIGAEITSVPAVVTNPERRVVYTVDLGFFGVDRIEYHAADAVLASLTATIELETPASKLWIGADATAPFEWSRANNWSPAGIPIATDSVQIPGSVALPITLTAPVQVAAFALGAGSILDLGPHALAITSHATNDGEVRGTGIVTLSGSSAVAHGLFPSLDVSGTVSLDGTLTVSGDLRIVSPGALTIGAQTAAIAGDLDVGGALIMTSASSSVDVEGTLTVVAGCAGGQPVLTAGTLAVAGDFLGGDCGGLDALAMSGSHTVVLDGMMAQTLSLPSSSPTTSHFRNLEVTNTSGVTVTTDIVVTATLTLGPGASLSSTLLVDAGALDLGTDATLATLGRLRVATSANLAAGADVVAGVFETGATLNIAPTASMTATQLEIGPSGSIPSNVGFTNLVLGADLTLTQSLSVPGDLVIGPSGALRLGGFTVSVGGDLTTQGALEMTDASDLLDVGGDAVLGTSCSLWFPPPDPEGWLVRGTVFLAGDLLASPCGLAQGQSHRIVFDGAAPQSAAEFGFGQLEVAAGSQLALLPATVQPRSVTLGAGASLTAQVVSLGGALATAGGSTFAATELSLSSPSLASVAGTYTVGLTILNGGTTVPALAYQDLTLNTSATLAGDTTVQDLSLFGDLTIGGHTLVVLGDLVARRGLEMTNALDDVTIEGNATFGGTGCVTGTGSTLTTGTLRLRGNLTQATCTDAFAGGAGHLTILDGTTLQSVSFANASSAWSRFGALEIADDAEVAASTNVTLLAGLTVGANALVTGLAIDVPGAFATAAGSSLSLTQLTLSTASPSLGGTLSAGRVILDGTITTVPPWTYQDLEIRTPLSLASDVTVEDLTILQSGGGALTVAGRHLTITGILSASGPLHMTNAADQVDVTGNATFGGSGCVVGSMSNLTAGVLLVRSTLNQSTCSDAFVASMNHVTRFHRAGAQAVVFGHPTTSRLASAEVAGGAVVNVNTNGLVASAFVVDGTLSVTLNVGALSVDGTLLVRSGGVLTNQRTTTVLGTLDVDSGATVTNARTMTVGQLIVGGQVTSNSGGAVAPTLTIQGSLTIEPGGVLTNHVTGSGIAQLTAQGPALISSGGTLANNGTATANDLTVDGTLTVAATRTLTIDGTVTLGATGVVTNDGTIIVTLDPSCPIDGTNTGTTNGPLTCP
jgi:hypothetical protein